MIIQLLGTWFGPHEYSGGYVVSYDPEYHLPSGDYDGGDLVTTPDRDKATHFTMDEAFALWRSGPTCPCHRLQDDGEPNRPLTAFTVCLDATEPEEVEAFQSMGSGSQGEPGRVKPYLN